MITIVLEIVITKVKFMGQFVCYDFRIIPNYYRYHHAKFKVNRQILTSENMAIRYLIKYEPPLQ